ncbi:pseudouridine synthase [uncultured Tenacibaculum sp.]|uniref:pseudouridine synthase n=1 Tax=uncultured Tenacibaculum sp. TaxID=174713 RepID=UPI0026062F65|nr:pseudouridine synthase [uncultured Tenacibaculum sp.]
MNLEIIYEDDFIIGVSKPNNMLVHHSDYSKNVSEEASLIQLLYSQIGHKLYPLHRLDRKTSGIILLSKAPEFVAEFQQLFYNSKIEKIYYGLVRGYSPQELLINTPVKGRDSNVYKDAETHLETKESIEINIPVTPYNTARYSIVKLTPKTGRLHQLRIHMNKISFPLIGDPKYGDNNHNHMFKEKFDCNNLFLHAYSLEFTHPYTNKQVILKTPFPNHWIKIKEAFKWDISIK